MKKIIFFLMVLGTSILYAAPSTTGSSITRASIVETASSAIGQVKYCLAIPGAKRPCPSGNYGKDPTTGYSDCSGFVSWVYSQAGVKIPQGTGGLSQISSYGCQLKKDFQNIQAGDVMYFTGSGGKVGHVVIATGVVKNGQVQVIQNSGGSAGEVNIAFINPGRYNGYYSADCILEKAPKGSYDYSNEILPDTPERAEWNLEIGKIDFQDLSNRIIATITKNFDKFKEGILTIFFYLAVVDFLWALILLLSDELDDNITVIFKKCFKYTFMFWIISSFQIIVQLFWDLFVGIGSVFGSNEIMTSIDSLWSTGMRVEASLITDFYNSGIGNLWSWLYNFNGMFVNTLFWIIAMVLVTVLIIFIIAQAFIIKLEFFFLVSFSVVYYAASVLEPFEFLKEKMLDIILSLGIKLVVLTALVQISLNTILERQMSISKHIDAFEWIGACIILWFLLNRIPKIVIAILNGKSTLN